MAKISGTVTLGAAETPGEATVLVLDETCESVVASTQSDDTTGAYMIDTLDDATAYYLMVLGGGVYRSKVYGPCIAQTESGYLYSYVSLLHFDGADGSTSFVDQSGKVWTAGNNAQIDASQSKFGGAAGLFDGSDDFISTPASADFGFGTGDFTIEAWVYRNAADIAIWDSRTVGGEPMVGYISAAGKISFYDGTAKEGSLVVPAGAWSHVAWCRSAGIMRMFVDGQIAYSAAYTSNMGSSRPMRIGNDVAGGADYNGWIDEFRVLKGYAIYTDTFSPPAEEFGNGRIVAQLHLDGSDGSKTITDIAGKVWTANGNAQLDSSESKFGGSSLYLDGASWIDTPDSADFFVGTGDYTLELFLKSAGNAAYDQVCGQRTSAGDYRQNLAVTKNNTNNTLLMGYTNGSSITSAAGTAVVFDDQWHHVAWVRNGTSLKQYVDGVLDASLTLSAGFSMIDMTTKFSIGRSGEYNGQYFVGHIDEVRLTKGAALYTADFDPPSSAFADPPVTDLYSDSVVSLLHFDGADGTTTFTDEKGVVWTVNGNAQIDTAQSKFGGASMLLDGNGDYISCAASADFGFGTGDFTVEGWFYRTGNNTSGFLADFRVIAGNSFVIWCSQTDNPNALGYSDENGVTFIKGVSGELALNNWTHWAITRASGTVRGFVNGVLRFTGADARDFGASQGVRLGSSATANQGAVGNLDDVRITKGVARYVSDFTPPRQPFPNP